MKQRSVQGPIHPVTETYAEIYANTLTVGPAAVPVYTPAPPAARLNAFTTLVQADPDNDGNVLVGNQHNQTIVLEAGNSITIAVDPSSIYVIGSAPGQVVNWLALG